MPQKNVITFSPPFFFLVGEICLSYLQYLAAAQKLIKSVIKLRMPEAWVMKEKSIMVKSEFDGEIP